MIQIAFHDLEKADKLRTSPYLSITIAKKYVTTMKLLMNQSIDQLILEEARREQQLV